MSNLGPDSDSVSSMILKMEKKLNPKVYFRRFWKRDEYCSLSSNQYWDWLIYLDVSAPAAINHSQYCSLILLVNNTFVRRTIT